MGFGIIAVRGKQVSLVTLGVLKLMKTLDHPGKLKHIFEKCIHLIESHHPDELAIEAPFYGKNIQSMLKLGRAQGVAMAAALSRSIPIFEYSPRKIKQSITGKGGASKEQVAAMLQHILSMQQTPQALDATDGLAVAVCHFFQKGATSKEKKYNSWNSFLTENPERQG